MAELYGLKADLPADIGDVLVDEEVPVGPASDPNTATVDDDEDLDESAPGAQVEDDEDGV